MVIGQPRDPLGVDLEDDQYELGYNWEVPVEVLSEVVAFPCSVLKHTEARVEHNFPVREPGQRVPEPSLLTVLIGLLCDLVRLF